MQSTGRMSPGGLFRNNGLSIVVVGLFLVFLLGQAIAGYHEHNQEQRTHHQPEIAFGEYLGSAHFLEATFENWESEFLQMGAYVILTVFLFQKGSSESKDPDKQEKVDQDPRRHASDPDAPRPVRQGGWQLKLYQHSLSLVLFALFLLSFVGHGLSGAAEYNQEQLEHGGQAISLVSYLATARFWFESFQNWQSEFLAVGAIVVLSIWLREQGSPESKPVAAPHSKTGAG
jgi:hypothetical protein